MQEKATMFRIWANRILKEFIIKGYVMDDARLREPENFFGKDYFEEQLERINEKEKQVPIRLPNLKIVVTGTQHGYKRPDGVLVIPIGCLRD